MRREASPRPLGLELVATAAAVAGALGIVVGLMDDRGFGWDASALVLGGIAVAAVPARAIHDRFRDRLSRRATTLLAVAGIVAAGLLSGTLLNGAGDDLLLETSWLVPAALLVVGGALGYAVRRGARDDQATSGA